MLAVADWSGVSAEVDRLVEKLGGAAVELRSGLRGLYVPPTASVGIYAHVDDDRCGVFPRGKATDVELLRCKHAVDRVGLRSHPGRIPLEEIHAGCWVKLAEVPASPLRRLGEWTNFFPGKYPGGIPNHAGPLAATLTGGLLGAGLGYGGGYVAEKLFPKHWRQGRTRRTLAFLGALAGSAPGLAYGGLNVARGRDFNDASATSDTRMGPIAQPDGFWERSMASAAKVAYDTWGVPEGSPDPARVELDGLGRTLWQSVDPRTATTAYGLAEAASKMPDPNPVPGTASPHQFGMLGTLMGAAGGGLGGYVAGRLVGKALGLLTGMPEETQNTLASTGATIGIVRALIPRMF